MTDKELLELAAKAVEIVGDYCEYFYTEHSSHTGIYSYSGGMWNPLTDDGDALRLAVKLGIAVQPYPIYSAPKHSVMARRYQCSSLLRDAAHPDVVELYGDDQDAATRRAIVRAAAEIGKEMK